jgi:hypothetical protein
MTLFGIKPFAPRVQPRASNAAIDNSRWLRLCSRALRVGVVKFGADGVGVGVVELVKDGQGLLPGVVGGPGVAGGVVGVAEVAQGGGFAVAVAELPA